MFKTYSIHICIRVVTVDDSIIFISPIYMYTPFPLHYSYQWLGCFKIQRFLSWIVAFYLAMIHAKRNSYGKFQPNQCGFRPTVTHFPIWAWRARKTPYLLYIKISILSQSFASRLIFWRINRWTNFIKEPTLWKYTFIDIYFITSWLYMMDEKCHFLYNKCVFSQCRVNFRA